MCLAVPGRLVETAEEDGVLMGKVDFGGVRKRVCLDHVRQAAPGDYVLVHVGYALSVISPEEASRVFEFLKELGPLEELEPEP